MHINLDAQAHQLLWTSCVPITTMRQPFQFDKQFLIWTIISDIYFPTWPFRITFAMFDQQDHELIIMGQTKVNDTQLQCHTYEGPWPISI